MANSGLSHLFYFRNLVRRSNQEVLLYILLDLVSMENANLLLHAIYVITQLILFSITVTDTILFPIDTRCLFFL